jgi:hypothetical protein
MSDTPDTPDDPDDDDDDETPIVGEPATDHESDD